MAGDLERIQSGGATEFNSNVHIINKLAKLSEEANNFAMSMTIDGCKYWYETLLCMDREISPLLNKKEEEDLAAYRKKGKVKTMLRPNPSLLALEREELDAYERRIKYYMHKKGLGVRAREDAGAAILR